MVYIKLVGLEEVKVVVVYRCICVCGVWRLFFIVIWAGKDNYKDLFNFRVELIVLDCM